MKQNEDIMEINGDNCIHYDWIRFRNYAIMQALLFLHIPFNLLQRHGDKKNNYMADSPNSS